MKAVKYTATYNGAVVGTRKSPRPYQFAVIMQNDEGYARARAYEYEPTDTDRRNFDYHSNNAKAQPGDLYPGPGYRFTITEKMVAEGQQMIVGGWEGYVAKCRAREIENFEARKAEGHYEVGVYGWSMSRKNAEKMAAQVKGWGRQLLGIVPAVPV